MNLLARRNTFRNPIRQLTSLQQEMDDLMRDFFSPDQIRWPTFSKKSQQILGWEPNMDVTETPEEYKVRVELPGVEEKDIDVTFQNNTLTVKGERRFEKEEKDENVHQIEAAYGSFQRSIPFGNEIDPERITANFKNGVLKISLKKLDEVVSSARRIAIS